MRRSSLSILYRFTHKTRNSAGLVPKQRIDRLCARQLLTRIGALGKDWILSRSQFGARSCGTPNGNRWHKNKNSRR